MPPTKRKRAQSLHNKGSKAYELANAVNAALGKNAVMMGNDPYLTVTFLPTEIIPIDELLQGGLPFGRFVEIFGDYCLAPETRVLTADLQWVTAGSLKLKDELIGFDEKVGSKTAKTGQSYRRAHVTSTNRIRQHCYKITTSTGTVIASDKHRWLARLPGQRAWIATGDLQPGHLICSIGGPAWETDESREAGYLAGFFDGEGYIGNETRVGVGQNPGELIDTVEEMLTDRGYEVAMSINNHGTHEGKDFVNLRLLGGRYEQLRFLGTVRPDRLLNDSAKLWEGMRTWSRKSNYSEVLSVEYVGVQEVVALGTSTKTLIAEGMLTHNSTLKSYIGYKAIASAQKRGMLAALIDTEHSYDPKWAEDIGVNTNELIYRQPDNGEQAIDIAEVLIRGGADIIVFDSVAAALPKSEQKVMLGGDKNIQPARLAQLMSLAMRKLTAANKKTTVLWINQTRVNVGVMFGTNETVPGGKALPFYASYRIAVRKAGKVTEDVTVHVMDKGTPIKKTVKQTVAQSIRATVEKSKLSAPYRDVMFNFDFRSGSIDEWLYLCYKALDMGLIAYERNLWWEIGVKNPKKYRGRTAFQEAFSQQMIREMVSPNSPSLGSSQPDKSKVVSVRKQSSKRVAQKRIPTQEPGESNSTGVIRKTSSKSKTRTRVIRSRKP